MLHLHLLGRVSVFLNGGVVAGFVSDKALALLCYLAMNPGEHRRSFLASLLWGEMPENRAAANLRMAVYNLQQILPRFLSTNRKSVGISDPSKINLDANRFLDGMVTQPVHQAAGIDLQDGQSIDLAEEIQRVLKLYRGEFMEGLQVDGAYAFEEWMLSERERLRQVMLAGLNRLTEIYLTRREFPSAADTLKQILEIEPWQEDAHRRLMDALARMGDFTGAVAQYERCRRELSKELGIEPMPETTFLFERILAARSRTRRHNIPLQPTPFVGRGAELARLRGWSGDPVNRLITITGPGGVGKTRLAVQFALEQVEMFLDGVFFVELFSLDSPDHLAKAILDTLGVPIVISDNPEQQLINYFSQAETLLILDNFEHLLPGARLLGRMLEAAPHLRILVTSRHRLALRWERQLLLEGLEYPNVESDPNFREAPAVLLYLQSARRVLPVYTIPSEGRSALLRIFRITESLPLALELIGASAEGSSLEVIAGRITKNLDLLTSAEIDIPERHRSLRAAIEHSWEILPENERTAFMRLSVFHRSFDRQAAVEIAEADLTLLNALIGKSILRMENTTRIGMHELLRQFAAEKLSLNQKLASITLEQHSTYFCYELKNIESVLRQNNRSLGIARLNLDRENLSAAWHWAVASRRGDLLSAACNALSMYYTVVSLFEEGKLAFSRAVEVMQSSMSKDLTSGSEFLMLIVDLNLARVGFLKNLADFSEAVGVLQEINDLLPIISQISPDRRYEIEARMNLEWGDVHQRQGNYQAAEEHYRAALLTSRLAASPHLEANCLLRLGYIVGDRGEYTQAVELFETSLVQARTSGDATVEQSALHALAVAAYFTNHITESQEMFTRENEILEQLGDRRAQGTALLGLCMVASHTGDFIALNDYASRARDIFHQIGERIYEHTALGHIAVSFMHRGGYETAKINLDQALKLTQDTADRLGEGIARNLHGRLYRFFANHDRAKVELESALTLLQELEIGPEVCKTRLELALLHYQTGNLQSAYEQAKSALQMAVSFGDQNIYGRALSIWGLINTEQGELQEATDSYRQALQIHLEIKQPQFAAEDYAGLARIALLNKKTVEALKLIEPLLDRLETQEPDGADNPGLLLWTCYQVLQAADDPRSARALSRARIWLGEQQANLPSLSARERFQQAILTHVQILTAGGAQEI